MLYIAMSFIFGALIFYTLGVWAERIKGRLRPWHLVAFWLGLVCDTTAMFEIAGGLTFNFHGVTGMLAILVMLIHAVWATIVLIRKDEAWILRFHKLSIIVWLIWLVPMLSGMIFGSSM